MGTSAGYLQLHDGCGRLMLRQRLHTSPVVRIRQRTAGMGKMCILCPWVGLGVSRAINGALVGICDNVLKLGVTASLHGPTRVWPSPYCLRPQACAPW